MTCIIGLEADGAVWIGGDSMASGGWHKSIVAAPKVFRRGAFLIGYTTSFRMGQILQYHLEAPTQSGGDTDAFMVAEFIPAVRACLKDHGYTQIENNREEAGTFLVGYWGKLYAVESDFQVNRWANGIAAVGAGAENAMGAMLATSDMKPKRRILNALAITAELCTGVCAPFYVKKMKG